MAESGLDATHALDEIRCLTEAGGRHATVFLIGERDPVSHLPQDLRGDAVVPHAELPALLRGAWNVDHGELSLPRLTNPSLLGKLLHVSCSLATGIGVGERDPAPDREQQCG